MTGPMAPHALLAWSGSKGTWRSQFPSSSIDVNGCNGGCPSLMVPCSKRRCFDCGITVGGSGRESGSTTFLKRPKRSRLNVGCWQRFNFLIAADVWQTRTRLKETFLSDTDTNRSQHLEICPINVSGWLVDWVTAGWLAGWCVAGWLDGKGHTYKPKEWEAVGRAEGTVRFVPHHTTIWFAAQKIKNKIRATEY